MTNHPTVLHLIDNIGIGGAQDCLLELVTSVEGTTHFGIALYGSICDEYTARLSASFKGNFYVITKSKYDYFFPAAWLKLVRLIKCISPQIIHTHLFYSFFFVSAFKSIKLFKQPMVFSIYGINEQSPWYIARGYRLFQKQTDIFLATDRKSTDEILQLGIPLSKIRYILLTYTLDHYSTRGVNIRNFYSIDKNEKLIVRVARLYEEKGYSELTNILYKLKMKFGVNFKALFVGDGPDRARIEKMVNALDLQGEVVFCGWQLNFIDYILAADVVVCTSIKEAFGLTNIAAIKHCLPFITFVAGSLDILKTDNYKYAIDGFSQDNFTEALYELMTQPAARSYAKFFLQEFYHKHFSGASMKVYSDIYVELANKVSNQVVSCSQ